MTTPDSPDEPTAGDQHRADGDVPADPPSEAATPSDPSSSDLPPPDDAAPRGDDPPPGGAPPPGGPPPGGTPPPSDPPPPGGTPPRGDDPPPGGTPPPGGPSSGAGTSPWPSFGGRRLYRRSDDRVIAGVASGLGDFFGVDPAIIRLAFVGLAIFGGSGFLLYLLGWVFLPVRGSDASLGEGLVRRVGGGRSAGGLVLIIVATLIILDSMHFFGGGLLWAALLIGIGVLLFRSDGDGDGNGGGAGANTQATEPVAPRSAGAAGRTRSQEPTTTAAAPSAVVGSTTATIPPDVYEELPPPPPGLYDDWRPTPQPPPPEPPRPPSILGRVTVAATLILIGAVALLESLTGLDVSLAGYVALALTTVGIGLLVGARWGRARGLIALGAVLLLTLTAVTFAPRIPIGSVGQQSFTPRSVADLQQPYDLGAGELVLDLTELQLRPSQRVEVQATMGVGSLQVIVPDGVGVEGQASTRAGTITALDQTRDGTDTRVTLSEPGDEGSPTIVLDVQNGVGEIKVRRDAAEVN